MNETTFQVSWAYGETSFINARDEAHASAVVLLSPACASFDQWPNFEARGAAFTSFVGELARRNTLGESGGAAAPGGGA